MKLPTSSFKLLSIFFALVSFCSLSQAAEETLSNNHNEMTVVGMGSSQLEDVNTLEEEKVDLESGEVAQTPKPARRVSFKIPLSSSDSNASAGGAGVSLPALVLVAGGIMYGVCKNNACGNPNIEEAGMIMMIVGGSVMGGCCVLACCIGGMMAAAK